MKTGKSLQALAAEIERQVKVKMDFTAPVGAIRAVLAEPAPGTSTVPSVELHFGDHQVGINKLAHNQLGEYLQIPAKYYDRMLTQDPELLTHNINTWIARAPADAERMIRTLDGRARAFLSDKYRPLDNADLLEAVLPPLLDLKVEIVSCEITETRLYIKAVDKRIERKIPEGATMGQGHTWFDVINPAITISNSEVGAGALGVYTSVFKQQCTNYAIVEKSIRKYHVGARAADVSEEVVKVLSDQTRRVTDAALWLQTRDVVKAAFEKAQFDAWVDEKVLPLTERKIKGDAVKSIDLTARKFTSVSVTETEQKTFLRYLIEGGSLSQWGMVNAITRAAQDADSYDRATELETLAGKVIELPANDWKVIAEAA